MSSWNFPRPQPVFRPETRGASSITSLIVSDDARIRNALADTIATEGSGTVAIDSIDEAIERLESASYPLVFVPQEVPGMSGSEICSRLRATEHGEHAWIIALPRLDVVTPRQIIAAGFDGVLRAPIEPADVAVLIAGATRNARASERLQQVVRREETFYRLVSDLAQGTTSEAIADHLLQAATEVLPNAAGAIWLRGFSDSTPILAGTSGLSAAYAQQATQIFSWFTDDRWLDLARQPMFVNAMSDAPRAFTEVARSEGFAASLTIALVTPAEVSGALVLYTREQTQPSARDIEMVEALTASASMALDRAEMVRHVDSLRTIIENIPDGVFICDAAGNFITANPALERLAGLDRASLEQVSLRQVLDPAWSGDLSSEVQRVRIIRPHDGHIEAEMHLTTLPGANDDQGGLVQGTLRDVSDQQRTLREVDAFRAAATASAIASDAGAAIDAVVAALRDQAGYAEATFWMVQSSTGDLVARAPANEEPLTVPIGKSAQGRAATTATPVFQRGSTGPLSIVGEPGENRVCVPVSRGSQVVGVLDVVESPGDRLTDEDAAFLQTIATNLAASLERIQLHQELRRQATIDSVTKLENRETFLRRLDASLSASKEEPLSLLIVGVDRFKAINDTYGHLIADELLRQVAETLKLRVRPPQAIARYTSDQFAVILPGTGRDEAPAIAENFRIGVATQLFMAAEQVEQMTVSVGAATYPNDADSLDQLLLASSHAMYLAKQAGRNQVYQSNEAFAHLAVAHGRIVDLLRQSPRETLALLVRAMDQRTPERAGHSQRVADYAIALGRALGMQDADLKSLRIAAVIHDIGMFSLPDSLLRKPSGLSDDERELLYSIPVNAHRLLSQIPLPESVLPSVVHQHEHWDGSGYPSGLKGDLIPPGARIIAVADAIDAMTSDRAHRQSLSMEEALQALAGQAGQRFDPSVVRAARTLLGELDDVSQDRAGSNLESTLVEALAVIPPVERASA